MAFLGSLEQFHTRPLRRRLPATLPVFLAGLCFLSFCGCARSREEKTADGRIILQYLEKWTGFEDDAMQAVVDDYNRSQNRVFVNKLTGLGEVERKLMLATAGGDPPDIAGIWPATIPGFSEKGAL